MTRRNAPGRATMLAASVAAAGLATAFLAGCSHGSGSGSHAATTPGAKAAGSAAVPQAQTIVNDPKARPSVDMKSCAATGSGWSAGGTVTNSKDKDATFTIVVSFTTKQSTVLARGETKVTVRPGATKSWTTGANCGKTKGTQCVLRGVGEG